METLTKIIDYDLKDCMVEQKCKNNKEEVFVQEFGQKQSPMEV